MVDLGKIGSLVGNTTPADPAITSGDTKSGGGNIISKGIALIGSLFKSDETQAPQSTSTQTALANNSIFAQSQGKSGQKMPDINAALEILNKSGGFSKKTSFDGTVDTYTDKTTGAYTGEMRTDPNTGGKMFFYKSSNGSSTTSWDKDGDGRFETVTKKNADGTFERLSDKDGDGYSD